MRTQNNGVRLAELLDEFTNFYDLRRVKTDRRLIQNDDVRISQQGLRDADPLTVAFGKMLNQLVRDFLRVGLRDDAVNLSGNVRTL